MKKIFALIFSVILFCLILGFTGCGKNRPLHSTASDTLPETTQSTTQSSTTSETSAFYETTETTDTAETSEFFDSSNGTLESTANPEDTMPSPLRVK